jgi:hypothetical protein
LQAETEKIRREEMFQKNQYIFSETLGVCHVDAITQLSAGREAPVAYYVLTPVFAKEGTSYIPVEDHQVVLRDMFSEEEARAMEADPNIDLEKNPLLKDAIDFVLHERRN